MQPTGTECAPNRPSPGPQTDWTVSDRAEPSRSWNLALPVIVAAVLAYTSWPALRAMVEAARGRGACRVFLEVRPSNPAAFALNQAEGVNEVGRRPRYYPAADNTREDAIVMAMELLGP